MLQLTSPSHFSYTNVVHHHNPLLQPPSHILPLLFLVIHHIPCTNVVSQPPLLASLHQCTQHYIRHTIYFSFPVIPATSTLTVSHYCTQLPSTATFYFAFPTPYSTSQSHTLLPLYKNVQYLCPLHFAKHV
jgi:hypothetical protein